MSVCVLCSSCCCGLSPGRRNAFKEDRMEYLIAGITAVFLFVYLLYALIRPERF